jgi:8-oxo-dGTP pyrophosphatase MutT (NUDIX family)
VASRGGQQRIPRPASSRPGAPAPWAALAPDRRRLSLADVRARLADLPPAAAASPVVQHQRAAAVLLPLFEDHGEAHVVLIKRPEWMPSHQGEIAFPGGKVEPGDADARAAALREAREEIGLEPNNVEIVAQLDGIGTVASRFTIAPFVGFLAGRPELAPDPQEVDRVLEVPLSAFLADDVYREERWGVEHLDEFGVHFYELEDETVWGATARILTGFLAHLVDA